MRSLDAIHQSKRVASYLQTAENIITWTDALKSALDTGSKIDLEVLRQLVHCARQPLDTGTHLYRVLHRRLKTLYGPLQQRLGTAVVDYLEQEMGWPSMTDRRIDLLEEEACAVLAEYCSAHMDVQQVYCTMNGSTVPSWDVASVLMGPILTKLHYHFSGQRPTNRIDHPEWLFDIVNTMIENHTSVLNQISRAISKIQGHECTVAEWCLSELISDVGSIVISRIGAIQRMSCDAEQRHELLVRTVEKTLEFSESLEERGSQRLAWTLIHDAVLADRVFRDYLDAQEMRLQSQVAMMLQMEDPYENVESTTKAAYMLIALMDTFEPHIVSLRFADAALQFAQQLPCTLATLYHESLHSRMERLFQQLEREYSNAFSCEDSQNMWIEACRIAETAQRCSTAIARLGQSPTYVRLQSVSNSAREERQAIVLTKVDVNDVYPSDGFFDDAIAGFNHVLEYFQSSTATLITTHFSGIVGPMEHDMMCPIIPEYDGDSIASPAFVTASSFLCSHVAMLQDELPQPLFDQLLHVLCTSIADHIHTHCIKGTTATLDGRLQLLGNLTHLFSTLVPLTTLPFLLDTFHPLHAILDLRHTSCDAQPPVDLR